VNLLLCGAATANAFDGDKVLGDTVGGTDDAVTLKGVPSRGSCGYLALGEALGNVPVGRHFKTPCAPVWVVYSESHYSVLFALDVGLVEPGAAAPREFDLYYFDGLANQDEEYRLTVDVKPGSDFDVPDPDDASALTPPLDLVIRTKWPGARVDWGDSEPIL